MRRYAPGLLAALLLLSLLPVILAGRGTSETPKNLPTGPAAPLDATLDWEEPTPASGPALTFSVRRFRITPDGWSAAVGIRNATTVTWRLGGAAAESRITSGSAFGVMVFPDDALGDLDAKGANVPPVRRASRILPALPSELRQGGVWRGTISGTGSLPAGLYVRISFGPIWTDGDPPAGLPAQFTWVTDHALSLAG
jgi:hypothetical protein